MHAARHRRAPPALLLATLAALLLGAPATADRSTTPDGLSLERIMSDPGWMGMRPQSFYFSDDGQRVYFDQLRASERIYGDNPSLASHLLRDRSVIALADGVQRKLDDAELRTADVAGGAYSKDRGHKAFVRDGDLFVKVLANGAVRQLTRTTAEESDPLWLDAARLAFSRDGDWFVYELGSGLTAQLADLEDGADPAAPAAGFDYLKDQQTRLFATLKRLKDDEERRRARVAALRATDPAQARAPIYLGGQLEVQARALAPSGRWLALSVQAKSADDGKPDALPDYVSRSGYVEQRSVRTLVGRNPPVAQSLLLVDLASGALVPIDLGTLSGLKDDPFKGMRAGAIQWHVKHGADQKAVEKKLEAPAQRGVTLGGMAWSDDGRQLAVQLFATDNKDRWLATVDFDKRRLVVQHRLTDPAWINYDFNEFGWLHDSHTLWYLSEETGYSHLYLRDVDKRKTRQLTRGAFEVHAVQTDRADRHAYYVANAERAGRYELYRVALATGLVERISDGGLRPEHLREYSDNAAPFILSPDEQQLLFRRDSTARPHDLWLQAAAPGASARRLTDTVSAEYAAIRWLEPELVSIPSTHIKQPIRARVYAPAGLDPNAKHPAVMFVHGAGYLQDAHEHYSSYFREFMFNNLLVRHGYVVIDVDYRASQGYGRDWRTAIYRQMGTPELEDFKDAVGWLVANRGVDPARVGVYGGSYGGFMTFMALFKEPELFAAGAALRPVTDWAHYNHGYTANILNTPELDPIAYEISSPIEHAAGLKRPLLICHGLLDDNVFAQDSIRLAQRLLELKKEDWELAVYPLDPHGFIHPDSWLDEYRRVFKLFEANLKP